MILNYKLNTGLYTPPKTKDSRQKQIQNEKSKLKVYCNKRTNVLLKNIKNIQNKRQQQNIQQNKKPVSV